jgi:hypothetical protein
MLKPVTTPYEAPEKRAARKVYTALALDLEPGTKYEFYIKYDKSEITSNGMSKTSKYNTD